MAYNALTDAETNAGRVVAQSLMKKIKDDLADHESRVASTEGAIAQLMPIEFNVYGILNAPSAETEIMIYRVSAAIQVLAVRAIVKTAGTSGTLSIDVEYKRGGGAWTSLMSGPISIGFGSGDLATSSGVLSFTDLLAGDVLRLNINSVQDGMTDFSVYIENKGA
jgi:hypothetical protein